MSESLSKLQSLNYIFVNIYDKIALEILILMKAWTFASSTTNTKSLGFPGPCLWAMNHEETKSKKNFRPPDGAFSNSLNLHWRSLFWNVWEPTHEICYKILRKKGGPLPHFDSTGLFIAKNITTINRNTRYGSRLNNRSMFSTNVG